MANCVSKYMFLGSRNSNTWVSSLNKGYFLTYQGTFLLKCECFMGNSCWKYTRPVLVFFFSYFLCLLMSEKYKKKFCHFIDHPNMFFWPFEMGDPNNRLNTNFGVQGRIVPHFVCFEVWNKVFKEVIVHKWYSESELSKNVEKRYRKSGNIVFSSTISRCSK